MKIKQSNRYGPATPADIKRLEKEVGYMLPAAYKNFLLKHNGGEPIPNTADFQQNGKTFASDVREFYGVHKGRKGSQVMQVLRSYRGRFVKEAVPIAEDSCGNYFLLVCGGKHKGKVFFWDHEFEPDEPSFDNMFLAGSTFARFCKGLYAYELPGVTEVEKLVESGDKEGVKNALDAGYDIETKHAFGRTLIEIAAIHNEPAIIQMLHDRGARWRSALKYAKENQEFFPEHKASVDLIERLKKKRR